MSIAAAFAADKTAFKAPAAADMPHKQTVETLVIGADPYLSGEKVKLAFGKLSPAEYGVLPVLVVMQNNGTRAIQLRNMRAEVVGPRGGHATATPPNEVKYAYGPHVPHGSPTPTPFPIKLNKKNPLDVWEIEGRAFAAQMLPAGNFASGFLYFQADCPPGSSIVISGLSEAGAGGRELVFFEIPLN